MKKLRTRSISSANKLSTKQTVLFGTAFAVVGAVILIATHAAGFSASLEGENSTLAGCATTGSDAGASGGSLLKFTSCSSQTQTLSSVSQYGITWTFDSPHTVGKYVNGDYWVQGPVTITNMTPAASGGHNGWEVNPVLAGNSDAASGFITADDANGGQAWDSNGTYYKASLMPSLPYAASAGQSIVKTISTSHSGDCSTTGCVQGAAVLTVVASSPANNGATVFRPPFVGSAKTLFTTSALDAQLPNLPRLSSTTTIDASLPTLSDEAAVMQGPDPGYSVEEWPGFHARANILPPNGSTTYSFGGDSSSGDTYEPGNTALYTDAIFRAVIAKSGDNETTRRQLVINMVQRGIDIYGEANAGMHWYAAGGHNLGPRIMLGFSAWMLNNDSTLAAPLASDNGQYNFAESGDLRPNRVSGGQPLHGQLFCTHGATCEASYWAVQSGQIDNQNDYDPYGYIDGGYVPSGSYEECCMSSALADEAMAVKLLPGMGTIWNNTMITKFANRWENHGLWTQPDPCAPLSQGGGPDSSHPGQCILDPDLNAGSTFTNFSCQAGKQCGRYPSIDGQSYRNTGLAPGGGGYSGDWGYTPLMHAIWNQYGPS